MQILVVEDEKKVAESLRSALDAEGFRATIAPTGEEGFFLATTKGFDLVVLDLMLPSRDGLQILTALRERGLKMPVLILTSRDTVADRVSGLNAGADDYLVKPFAIPEFLARIRALLRRGRVEVGASLKLGNLEMDTTRHKATRGGKELTLTAHEFSLLEYLLRHEGRVVSREMLARDVWKETLRHTPLDNVIDVHIARLRKKVDDPFRTKLLHTVRGVGFVLREDSK